MPWKNILESSWLKWVGGAAIGLVGSVISSFAPDAFWVHDNRQAISILLATQPLVQRDIADLKTGLGEVNLTMKELIVEMQKRQAFEAAAARRRGR
jgi:hypothetical protein